MEKSKLNLSIDGRDYTVISDQSEEYLVRLGLLVDRNIRDVREAFPTISTTDAAVLAALNIADEYLRLQDSQPPTIPLEQSMDISEKPLQEMVDELQDKETLSRQTQW